VLFDHKRCNQRYWQSFGEPNLFANSQANFPMVNDLKFTRFFYLLLSLLNFIPEIFHFFLWKTKKTLSQNFKTNFFLHERKIVIKIFFEIFFSMRRYENHKTQQWYFSLKSSHDPHIYSNLSNKKLNELGQALTKLTSLQNLCLFFS